MSITGIGEVADLAKNIIGHFWPDKTKEQQAEMQLQVQELISQSSLLKGQMDVNAAEASAASGKLGSMGALFVAGWRPAVGWSCAAAFSWSFVLAPMLEYFAALIGHPITGLPKLDLSNMMPVLLGMLGLGTMRSVEKVKGLKPGE